MNYPLSLSSVAAPAQQSREQLLQFIRAHTPDLRIEKQRLDDGRRACLARFSFRGESFEVEAVEADGIVPDDEVVRRVSWLIYRRLGIRTQLDVTARDKREAAIVEATQRGDADLAARLGLELALSNEGHVSRSPVRARWER